ncbi:MAG: small multi-drug export protein [Propionibacteriales bacterium]|nr:small multi-drug export protein [Propionibacteriales bacterium]
MIEALQNFTQTLPEVVQWLAVMAIGAIPYVESHGASLVGVAAGLPPVLAFVLAVLGNLLITLPLILLAARVRARVTGGRAKELTPRQQKVRRAFDRFGVAGVSLIGPILLPSQFTGPALVSIGAPRRNVITWQVIAILAWGLLFTVLAGFGINLLAGR